VCPFIEGSLLPVAEPNLLGESSDTARP
jgi:hypothetical protein